MVAELSRLASATDIERMTALFDAQKRAFAADPMPSARDRKDRLRTLKDAIIAGKESLADAVHGDFGGRSRHETYAELLSTVQGVRYCMRHVKGWMRPDRRRSGLLMATTRSRVYYQPKGVVGIIVPWNYPLALSIGPLVSALSAGNRVMIKMSEATPRTADTLRGVLATAFPEDEVAVITGDVDVGVAFSRLAFDHLLFTGGTDIGRHIMRSAAENLTPVTLELGGKSPTLITDDVPIGLAAERICFGKAFNAGQTCVAPDYVLCVRERVDEFIGAFREAFEKMYPDPHGNVDYTCIVNDRHYERLQGYLADAREKGAEVIELTGGSAVTDPGHRKMPLHILKGVSADMQVMQEEIFGPILPIVPYDDVDEAIAFINARPRPLALNLFDMNKDRRRRILAGTHSGGVCINDAVSHFIAEDLPFGGVGDSGMGHYHAYEGFLTFSHHKAVLSRPRLNTARLLYAPHGGWLQKLLYALFMR